VNQSTKIKVHMVRASDLWSTDSQPNTSGWVTLCGRVNHICM